MSLVAAGVRALNFRMRMDGLTQDVSLSPSGLSVYLPVVDSYFIGGKQDGEKALGLLPPNTTVKVEFGKLKVRRGFARIHVNPVLFETALTSCVSLIEEREEAEVALVLRPFKVTNLDLPWLVRLYMED